MTQDYSATEGRLLGAILQDNSALEAIGDVRPEDFGDQRHRFIFKNALELIGAGKPADILSLTQIFLDRGEAERAGGIAYLSSLTDGVLPQRAQLYAQSIRDGSARRKARAIAELIISKSQDGQVSNDELLRALDAVEQCREALLDGRSTIRRLTDIPDVFSLAQEPVSFIVEELIQAGAIAMLTGEPGVGKSYLAQRMAVDVAVGAAFLGLDCFRVPVLYLDAENPLGLVQTRIEQIAGGPIGGLNIWGGWLSEPQPQIGDPRLLAIAKQSRPLIIFDSFLRFHTADENCASEMRSVMAHLRRLADAGASVLLLHHKSKAEGSKYRGSSDILAGVDCGMALEKTDEGLLRLHRHKSRFGAERWFTVRADFETGSFELTESPVKTQRDADIDQVTRLIDAEPGLSQRQVLSRIQGISWHKLRQLLIANEGKLWRVERNGTGKPSLYFPLSGERCSVAPLKGSATPQHLGHQCSSDAEPLRNTATLEPGVRLRQ